LTAEFVPLVRAQQHVFHVISAKCWWFWRGFRNISRYLRIVVIVWSDSGFYERETELWCGSFENLLGSGLGLVSWMNCADNWYEKLQLSSRQKFPVPFFLFIKRGIRLIPREKGWSTRVRLIFFLKLVVKKNLPLFVFLTKILLCRSTLTTVILLYY